MKKFLIPFIITLVVGVILSSSFLGVFIWKTNSMANLQTDFEDLTTGFEDLTTELGNLTTNYNTLLTNYNLLVGENEDLLDDYNALLLLHNSLQDDYNTLFLAHNNLQEDYDSLLVLYNGLQDSYNDLLILYNTLQTMYDVLEAELDAVIDMIKSLPMLDKMTFYYHWCREEYGYGLSSLELAKRMILHGSWQYNGFTTIDDILDDYNFWEYDDSMTDSWIAITNCLGSWLDCWSGYNWEEDIFDWITTNLDYRYDDETAYNRFYWYDLFLSPLEMLKYRCGDCDDFAILGGAMFENNFYDVYFATIHDDTYYPGELHHAFLWVEIGEERIDDKLPWINPNVKWSIGGGGYDWLIVDLIPYWQDTIWKKPYWLKWYYDNGYSSSDWMPFVDKIECDPPL